MANSDLRVSWCSTFLFPILNCAFHLQNVVHFVVRFIAVSSRLCGTVMWLRKISVIRVVVAVTVVCYADLSASYCLCVWRILVADTGVLVLSTGSGGALWRTVSCLFHPVSAATSCR